MLSHRDGGVVELCDGCYRPRPTGEGGWMRGPGFRAAPAVTDSDHPGGKGHAMTQAAQPSHWCPGCVDSAPYLGGALEPAAEGS